MRLLDLLKNPAEFFEGVRGEGWKPAFSFFLKITIALSAVTPVVNYLGVESTDLSSAYQAQTLSYRLLKGPYSPSTASTRIRSRYSDNRFRTCSTHTPHRLSTSSLPADGRKGPILNAWKAACYGVGPSILGGFLPYISLFAASYSLPLQLYVGPKVCTKLKSQDGL